MCCIIVSKPAGIPLPNLDVFRNCWERNPHGAGYAVAKDGAVHIRKGFMTWQSFAEIDFTELTPLSCVFHFRYATHGSQSAGNCHPFPVSGNLRQCYRKTDVAIAHNGIINRIAITKRDYSDTMSYIEKRIAPYWTDCKASGRFMYSVKASQSTLLKETNSKWAFLFTSGHIFNVGQGIVKNELWFSNAGFRPHTFSYSSRLSNEPRQTTNQDWNSDPDWVEWNRWYHNRRAISCAEMY